MATDDSSLTDEPGPAYHKTWKRSYLRRQGHISKGQKRALRELWPHYGCRFHYGETLDLEALFGGPSDVVVEVGFGHGEILVEMALDRPEMSFLGLEVHRPGVGSALKAIHKANLSNVRVLKGDALQVFQDHLDPGSLAEVCVFYPDPWLRDKDVERRLIRPWFLDLVYRALRPGGLFRLTTDVPSYAQHSVALIESHGGFVPCLGEPYRGSLSTQSKYEEKGEEKGHVVTHLEHRRVGGAFAR